MPELEKWFDSVETDRPFETCKICDQLLPLAADTWVVNKHYHRGECIMEYAVCENCRDRVSGKFSEDSKAAIRDFLENGIDWERRMAEWMLLQDTAERLDACVACRTPRDGSEGFTISAQFGHNGTLIEGALPLLMCSGCVAQVTASLSRESRKVWQDFIARHFEGPDSEDIDLGIF
ncbi:hypothetical protein HZ994_01910 [Akkermansiaceae bacterium]|nr:hypothetical protein HZ994_01910 [Akkermansiaceae bacterium]